MVLGYKGLDLSDNSFHQGTELSSRLSALEKWEDRERLKKKKKGSIFSIIMNCSLWWERLFWYCKYVSFLYRHLAYPVLIGLLSFEPEVKDLWAKDCISLKGVRPPGRMQG